MAKPRKPAAARAPVAELPATFAALGACPTHPVSSSSGAALHAAILHAAVPAFPPAVSLATVRGCSFEASRRRCPQPVPHGAKNGDTRATQPCVRVPPQRGSQRQNSGLRVPARFQQSSQAATAAARRPPGAKISTGIDGPLRAMAAPEAMTYISPAHEAMKPFAERPAKTRSKNMERWSASPRRAQHVQAAALRRHAEFLRREQAGEEGERDAGVADRGARGGGRGSKKANEAYARSAGSLSRRREGCVTQDLRSRACASIQAA